MRLNRLLWIVLAAVLAVAMAACGGGGKPADKGLGGDATKGQVVFAETCASCHGPDGKGLPGNGKDLTKSAFADGKTDQELLDFIKQGRPPTDPLNTTKVDMPPRGGNPALTDEDLTNAIAYLRTISVAKKKK